MLVVDTQSDVPVVKQLANGLRHEIASGALTEGQFLPSVRQLAADLDIHWNTVARAYRLLAEEGRVRVEQGRGAVVLRQSTNAGSQSPPPTSISDSPGPRGKSHAEPAMDRLITLLEASADLARQLDVDRQRTLQLLESVLDRKEAMP